MLLIFPAQAAVVFGLQHQLIPNSVCPDGKRTSVKPWDDNRIIFVTDDIVGTLVYGRLAETTNPVENVLYQLVDNFKLIARFRETNPLRETTTGQAIVAPIIENIDQIYVLDISQGQVVDEEAEDDDTEDEYVTVWGNKYGKADFIAAYNALEGTKTPKTLKSGATDVTIIKAVNKLSVDQTEKLKNFVTAYPAVTPDKLTFTNAADSTGKTVTVTPNGTGTVTATSSEEWCTASYSGTNKKVTVTVTANGTSAKRTATVTVACGTRSVTFTVEQAA